MNDSDWLVGGPRNAAAPRAIMAAARAVLADRGLEGFTPDAVARRAGCSRATVYRHTGGRQQLLDAVVAESAGRVGARIAGAAEGNAGTERVVEVIVAALHAIRSDRALRNWIADRRTTRADGYFAEQADISAMAAGLAGLPKHQEHPGGQWIVRIVLTFLAWPLPTPQDERRMIETFVAPGFAGLPPPLLSEDPGTDHGTDQQAWK